jgi:hypothetical protein
MIYTWELIDPTWKDFIDISFSVKTHSYKRLVPYSRTTLKHHITNLSNYHSLSKTHKQHLDYIVKSFPLGWDLHN